MATKRTMEAPVEEQVSKAEDVLQVVENDVVESSANEKTEPVEVLSESVESEESAAVDFSALSSKEEILNLLAERVNAEPTVELRAEVEALKVAFYKIHRAEVDARRKAFFEENGEGAEYHCRPARTS